MFNVDVIYVIHIIHVAKKARKMTSIRLDNDTENRLNHLARVTGRTKSYYLRKLISENLDDLENQFLAEQRLEMPKQRVGLDQMRDRLGLVG